MLFNNSTVAAAVTCVETDEDAAAVPATDEAEADVVRGGVLGGNLLLLCTTLQCE